MLDNQIVRRKGDHLRIVAQMDVEHTGGTLLSDVQLVHQALPELNLNDIDTSTEFFGRTIAMPLMITSMTGGAKYAKRLNRALALVANKLKIPFSVGSQRVILSHPHLFQDFVVRPDMPDTVLLGNIGGVQLVEHSIDDIVGLNEKIEADGMCVHLNAAQELIQGEEGQHTFQGVLDQIARLVDRLEGNVLVKETGAGLSVETLEKLKSVGVPYIDVAGAGGTSWTKVEQFRAVQPEQKGLGMLFGEWGIPTAFSTIAARRVFGDSATIVAAGGIRDGLDVAKSIALGADLAGFARPVLLQYLERGGDLAQEWLEGIGLELKSAMFLTGSRNLTELRNTRKIISGDLRDTWLAAYGWDTRIQS